MAKRKYELWRDQSADEEAMVTGGVKINHDVSEFSALEQSEILAQIPLRSGKEILELGGGIGRYTKKLLIDADRVISVDFVGKFLRKNYQLTKKWDNVAYICACAQFLNFKSESFDLVFTNWLFMYLEDEEVQNLIEHIHQWLKPTGIFFMRESCNRPSINDKTTLTSCSRYRDPAFYRTLLPQYFTIQKSGNIALYQTLFNNPFQLYWVCKKRE